LNSTQKLRRHSRNGRKWAHSDRKQTLRPITSPSLNSPFYTQVLAIPRSPARPASHRRDLQANRTVQHALTNHVRP
jgi:hypothetical protein